VEYRAPGISGISNQASSVLGVKCYCCCDDYDPATMAALHCHSEIAVCQGCISWLTTRAGGVDVTPTLPVSDLDEATSFYEAAGFHLHRYSDGYAFVHLSDQSVFDLGLEPIDPATNRAGCCIIVTDVDDWHVRLTAADLPVTAVEDQEYGMREFTLTDPSGNRLRLGQTIPETAEAP